MRRQRTQKKSELQMGIEPMTFRTLVGRSICKMFQLSICKMFQLSQKVFSFDVRGMDWNGYFKLYYLGLKKFVLKEDFANIPMAQQRIRK